MGACPNALVYARVNAAALPKPTRRATAFTRSPRESSRRPRVRRQALRYAAGVVPTTSQQSGATGTAVDGFIKNDYPGRGEYTGEG